MSSRLINWRLQAIAARGLAMVGSFLQVVVISRALTLDDAGLVFLLFTLMNLAATVGRFGTDNLVLRRIASNQSGHAVEARWLKAICWAASSMSGTILFFLLISGVLPLPTPGLTVLDAACVGIMTVFYSLSVFAGAVLRGSGVLVAGIWAELGIAPWLTSTFVGLQMLTGEATVSTVLGSLLAAGVITALWALRAARPVVATSSNMDWQRGFTFMREHTGSLASLMGTSLLFFALVWVPQLGLGVVGTGAQVAQYTAAARIASLITIFPGIQTSYLGPRFAALAYSNRRQELGVQCGRATAGAMLAAVPLLMVISAAPEQLLDLFGARYGNAAVPTLILCIGAYVGLAFGPVNTLMLAAGLEGTSLILNGLLLAVVAVLTVLGAPTIGVVGVSIVSAAGGLTYSGLASALITRKLRVNPTLMNYFRPAERAPGRAPITSDRE